MDGHTKCILIIAMVTLNEKFIVGITMVNNRLKTLHSSQTGFVSLQLFIPSIKEILRQLFYADIVRRLLHFPHYFTNEINCWNLLFFFVVVLFFSIHWSTVEGTNWLLSLEPCKQGRQKHYRHVTFLANTSIP